MYRVIFDSLNGRMAQYIDTDDKEYAMYLMGYYHDQNARLQIF